MKIGLLHGANFRFLGVRTPEVYGDCSLATIEENLRSYASLLRCPLELHAFQSNHEGALIDFIETLWQEKADGIILNAGAYTHTSIALADALEWVKIPTVEVHISNIYAREEFRSKSFVAKHCVASIQGCGILGYKFALETLLSYTQQ